MKRGKMRGYLVITWLLTTLCLPPLTAAASKPTAIFLKTEPGARLFSMGGVFNSGNYTDAFFNPWELGWLVNKGVDFSTWSGMIEDSSYNFFTFILPKKRKSAFGFGYLGYKVGRETIEEIDGTSKNIWLENNSLLFVSYGRNISKRASIGGSVKHLSTTLAEEFKAEAVLMDAGISFHTLNDKHKFSLGIKNFGQDIKYLSTFEPPPTSVYMGYAVTAKPVVNHRITLCGSLGKGIYDGEFTFSGGVEYSPCWPFISLRAGLKKEDKEDKPLLTSGVGLNYKGMELNVGYGKSNKYTRSSLWRISLSLMPPYTEYERAKEYLNRGMWAKAVAIWESILPGEAQYADACTAIKLHKFPPQLLLKVTLKDNSGDGILAGGESGLLHIEIINKGKSEASEVRLRLKPQGRYGGVAFSSFEQLVGNIPAGGRSEVSIQVTGEEELSPSVVSLKIGAIEKEGYCSPLYIFNLRTKPSPPPELIMGKYTFREDNSGYSKGNGNGAVEVGEQVEISGFVVNMGESVAKNVVMELLPNHPHITIIPEISKMVIGDLMPKEYKKVVCGFKVGEEYRGSLTIPVSLKLAEEGKKYSRLQPLEIILGKCYPEAIIPSLITLDKSKILPPLPDL